MSDLLSCPFCNESDDLHADSGVGVTCGNCGAFAGSMHKSKDTQISIWNTRASDSRIKELEGQLAELTSVAKYTAGLAIEIINIDDDIKTNSLAAEIADKLISVTLDK